MSSSFAADIGLVCTRGADKEWEGREGKDGLHANRLLLRLYLFLLYFEKLPLSSIWGVGSFRDEGRKTAISFVFSRNRQQQGQLKVEEEDVEEEEEEKEVSEEIGEKEEEARKNFSRGEGRKRNGEDAIEEEREREERLSSSGGESETHCDHSLYGEIRLPCTPTPELSPLYSRHAGSLWNRIRPIPLLQKVWPQQPLLLLSKCRSRRKKHFLQIHPPPKFPLFLRHHLLEERERERERVRERERERERKGKEKNPTLLQSILLLPAPPQLNLLAVGVSGFFCSTLLPSERERSFK